LRYLGAKFVFFGVFLAGSLGGVDHSVMLYVIDKA